MAKIDINKENVDGVTELWLPDPELCSAQEEMRRMEEWRRPEGGKKRPSEIGIRGYRYGKPLHKKFYEGRTPPQVPLDSAENLEWYAEHLSRAIHGYEYKGQRITGDMYWFLNFTPFAVAIMDKVGNPTTDFNIAFPFFSYQHDYIFKSLEESHMDGRGFMLMGGRGYGKEQPHYEEIMTPTGKTTMGAIKPGDIIFGKDGKQIKVLQKHPQGIKDVYRVYLDDGRFVDCGIDHLWSIVTNKGEKKTLKLGDMLSTYTVGTRKDHRYFIETSKSVDYETKQVPIDPYVLGLLIGDGSLTQGVRISTVDDFIIDKIKNTLGKDYKVNYLSGVDYSITYTPNSKQNPLLKELRKMGLNKKSTHKFIPKDYIFNSKETRLELLRGLMDSDGYISKMGTRDFYSSSEVLVDDVVFLARSLGMKSIKKPKWVKYNGGRVLSFRVTILTNENTFHLPRKNSRQMDSVYRQQLRAKSAITKIEKLKVACESSCITVDAADSLYLTKDFIPTHNTYMMLSILAKSYYLKPDSHNVVSASKPSHAEEAFDKLKRMLTAIDKAHPTLALSRLVDTKYSIKSGYEITRDGVKMEEGPMSSLQRIVYGDNPGITRGSRPDVQLLEEIGDWSSGKGDLKSCLGASKGSWRVGSLNKCRVLLIGTGGSVASDQAKDVFLNPRAYSLATVNDFQEEVGRPHCLFVPSDYLLGGMGWERTAVNDNDRAREFLMQEREDTKDDMEIHEKTIQEYPLTIAETFRKSGTNIFNQRNISKQWTELTMGPEDILKPKKGFLDWKRTKSGSIIGVTWATNPDGNIEVLEHPYHGENESLTFSDLYVAGVDGIDQGILDSTSIKNRSSMACLIKKRIVDGGYFTHTSNIYVAKYLGRSLDVRDDYEEVLKLSMYYGAKVNLEYTKIGIVQYFREKKQYHRLMKRPMIAMPSSGSGDLKYLGIDTSTHLIGTTTAAHVIDHQDGKIKEYVNEYSQSIFFIDMLEQLRDYQREDRRKYDLVVAMGLCELADEDMLGVPAKSNERETEGLSSFGYYTDDKGIKRYGVVPTKTTIQDFLKSPENQGYRWVDSSGIPRFDKNYDVLDARDLEK